MSAREYHPKECRACVERLFVSGLDYNLRAHPFVSAAQQRFIMRSRIERLRRAVKVALAGMALLFLGSQPVRAQPPLSVPMVITVEPIGQRWVVHAMDTPFDVTTTIKDLKALPAELHEIGEMYQAYEAQAPKTGTQRRKENDHAQRNI